VSAATVDLDVSTPTEIVKLTEELYSEVEVQPILTVEDIDTVTVTEVIAAAVSAQPNLEISVADAVALSEVLGADIEAYAALEISVVETIAASDECVAAVVAQIALELAVTDSVAVVDSPLLVTIGAGVVVGHRHFTKIPGRKRFGISKGSVDIPGDGPVDAPYAIAN
jgi:hypothetical protein